MMNTLAIHHKIAKLIDTNHEQIRMQITDTVHIDMAWITNIDFQFQQCNG